jgi:SAM-dependent methyltransferase
VTGDPPGSGSAAERWAELLSGWGLPKAIVDQARESPWGHEPQRFAVDEALDRDTTSARWAREVLPPAGGTVVDVGCGGGRSSLTLAPPASELIGVDRSGAMLDEFVRAATSAGVARRTVHGSWPDVADVTPIADVVVCNHVLYDVSDVVPFVLALTDHARLAVVVEIPTRHPMSAMSPAFRHFWNLERPDGPTPRDLVAVLDELGLQPETTRSPSPPPAAHVNDPAHLVSTVRRRLCLGPERDEELAAWLAVNPPPWIDEVATIRWPGSA